MSDLKQVKVDNWGIYFLQRLKHFFNRTDYCDLTLQFQDNAQLKVHRLVLSACTEYFELLERTCEMYEDCLVMPDDLQADVVVPIVNFMYTGQLEFKLELLDSLHQTSQIMNMPVLTKLLDAHRVRAPVTSVLNYNSSKRSYAKTAEKLTTPKQTTPVASSSNATISKRSYSKAFGSSIPVMHKEKKIHHSTSSKPELPHQLASSPVDLVPMPSSGPSKKLTSKDPRPTRYELPEELDTDNIFHDSFSNISYTSQPLMIHSKATRAYPSRRSGLFEEASSSKKYGESSKSADIVECKKITSKEHIFEDDEGVSEESEMFQAHVNIKNSKVSNQLFDQILDHQNGPKVTIETKDNKQVSNIDHAKIISEVLKKYPHLVKSNKNIKLKIVNTPSTSSKKKQSCSANHGDKVKSELPDFTYESDVLDSKEAARLIALGPENVAGPWICLICGTPGRALHFTSYYKFRRHLVEEHNEKPASKICEYCGLKSLKRNYLLHHLYTKHGVDPPPSYHFPKCNICNYVALTEAFLVKHKLSHIESRNFRCNVCATTFATSNQLLVHIQNTGHKYSAERKPNLQCIYCLKVFLRDSNLYAHLKTYHKEAAKSDEIIDESDEEESENVKTNVKCEPSSFENEYDDVDSQYQIQQRPDGNIQLISKKRLLSIKQKILNTGLSTSVTKRTTPAKASNSYEYSHEAVITKEHDEIVMIDNNEYVMKNNKLVPRRKMANTEYIVSNMVAGDSSSSTSIEFSNIHNTIPQESMREQKVIINKSGNINQPIQIVVSNEEEYKALMNSNHSIIFDDGNTNKTLAVLRAPESTELNTTIDMDTTQSNEMMIIPDNYPMTVSEALPADNSNIVVVYSHPVDDQNKEYQLITSESIGAQFVQSSAVITQNYGTNATTAPIMAAHVIDAQESESWQSNVQENVHNQHIQMTPVTEIQEMAVVEQTIITTENANIDNIDDLPEVTLTAQIPQDPLTHQQSQAISIVTVNENDVSTTEGALQNISPEIAIENNVIESESFVKPNNNDSMIDDSLPQSDIKIVASKDNEKIDQPAITEHGPEIEDQTNVNHQTSTESVAVTEQETVPIGNQVVLTKVTKEQIQTLASEWSEDEDETGQRISNSIENTSQNTIQTNLVTTENASDLEKSVENIPQDMETQMSEAPETDPGTEESINSSQEDNLTTLREADAQHPANVRVEAPQEKISSLLNDWEDNDSQEENESTNTNVDEQRIIPENTGQHAIDTAAQGVEKPKSDEKIKSLVSDWDDDEEENKT